MKLPTKNAISVGSLLLAKISLKLILSLSIIRIKSSVQNVLQSLAGKIIWNAINKNTIPRTLWHSPQI